jgi:hypothetical protein
MEDCRDPWKRHTFWRRGVAVNGFGVGCSVEIQESKKKDQSANILEDITW